MSDNLRGIDAALARVLGWEDNEQGERGPYYAHEPGAIRCWKQPPAFSVDPAAIRLIEDEIEQRHLTVQYIASLMDEVKAHTLYEPGSERQTGMIWALIRATPEQRCRAALAVLTAHQASSSDA